MELQEKASRFFGGDARSMPNHQQRQTVAMLGDQRVAASERLEQRLTGMAVPRAVHRITA